MKMSFLCAVLLAVAVPRMSLAAPTFYGTTEEGDVTHWEVATHVTRDYSKAELLNVPESERLSFFPVDGFQPAVMIPPENRAGFGWIADVPSGSHGVHWEIDWTFFHFRQSFDLTGYDPNTVNLSFRWGADDNTYWLPMLSLNGGTPILNTDVTCGATCPTGVEGIFGDEVTLSSGFVSGINTLDFYVLGNGYTDAFALRVTNFSVQPAVPEPQTYALLFAGLGLLCFATKQRRAKR